MVILFLLLTTIFKLESLTKIDVLLDFIVSIGVKLSLLFWKIVTLSLAHLTAKISIPNM